MNTSEDLEPPMKKVRQTRVSNNGIFSTSREPIKEWGVVLGSGGGMGGGRNEKILLSLFLINERKVHYISLLNAEKKHILWFRKKTLLLKYHTQFLILVNFVKNTLISEEADYIGTPDIWLAWLEYPISEIRLTKHENHESRQYTKY